MIFKQFSENREKLKAIKDKVILPYHQIEKNSVGYLCGHRYTFNNSFLDLDKMELSVYLDGSRLEITDRNLHRIENAMHEKLSLNLYLTQYPSYTSLELLEEKIDKMKDKINNYKDLKDFLHIYKMDRILERRFKDYKRKVLRGVRTKNDEKIEIKSSDLLNHINCLEKIDFSKITKIKGTVYYSPSWQSCSVEIEYFNKLDTNTLETIYSLVEEKNAKNSRLIFIVESVLGNRQLLSVF